MSKINIQNDINEGLLKNDNDSKKNLSNHEKIKSEKSLEPMSEEEESNKLIPEPLEFNKEVEDYEDKDKLE